MDAAPRLAAFLAAASDAGSVTIDDMQLLPNGAVQENWLLDARFSGGTLAGRQRLVLRTDAATSLGIGLGRAQEFAVQRAAHRAGVAVAEPLFLCTDRSVIGKPFFVMRWVAGHAAGRRIVIGASAPRLEQGLAHSLATIHAIRPDAGLGELGAPSENAALSQLDEQVRFLATDPEPHPVAEWAICWLRRALPPPVPAVLCHGDFRTGNYLVDRRGLRAVLDWEFAHWGDPDEDLGWFCLGCWRFGAYHLEAGGIARRDVFYRAYADASGRKVDPWRVRWWEVLAALRWLVIALRQRDRCLKEGELSLDLALTGRRPAECELEILRLTAA